MRWLVDGNRVPEPFLYFGEPTRQRLELAPKIGDHLALRDDDIIQIVDGPRLMRGEHFQIVKPLAVALCHGHPVRASKASMRQWCCLKRLSI